MFLNTFAFIISRWWDRILLFLGQPACKGKLCRAIYLKQGIMFFFAGVMSVE
jgi:hypothetical protein